MANLSIWCRQEDLGIMLDTKDDRLITHAKCVKRHTENA